MLENLKIYGVLGWIDSGDWYVISRVIDLSKW